jgi:hypothetical protein
VLPAGCVPPPPHVHRQQVEEYEVLEGQCDVVVEGEWRTVGPGDAASVLVGALHTFRNRSGAVVRVRNWHRPAMRFEDFIDRTCRTLEAAGITRKRDPRVALCLSMIMLDFEDTLAPGRKRERIPMRGSCPPRAAASYSARLSAPTPPMDTPPWHLPRIVALSARCRSGTVIRTGRAQRVSETDAQDLQLHRCKSSASARCRASSDSTRYLSAVHRQLIAAGRASPPRSLRLSPIGAPLVPPAEIGAIDPVPVDHDSFRARTVYEDRRHRLRRGYLDVATVRRLAFGRSTCSRSSTTRGVYHLAP